MYSLPVSALLVEISGRYPLEKKALTQIKKAAQGDFDYHVISALLVEVSGIEPLTSCMPCKRSPS